MSKPESREVTWDIDDTRVYATVTGPGGGGPNPGVVFVAGSGPTDRNWKSPLLPGINGSGRLLAMALAGAGFVTIRYDKRASGVHAEENVMRLIGKMSLEGHVDELAGAVDALAARPDVDPARIFALTNSEGAIHALNYQHQAKSKPFAGLVLTAPPGRPISEVARTQVSAIMSSLPNGDQLMARYDEAVADFVAGRPVEPDPALPEGARMLLLALTTRANLPFARQLWDIEVARMLEGVTEPVLIVIGKKDIQVDRTLDGGRLEAAVGGRDNVTFVYPENANHVLKYEEKPREQLGPADGQTYNEDGRILDPETLEAIRGWLVAHT